jgi:hypothetical protein
MAAVRVNRGMPRPEAPASSLPKDQWRDLAIVREMWAKSQLPFDCRLLQQVAADAPLMAPELGYGSPEEFLREELQLDPDLVNRVVGWLEQEQPIEAVPLGVADRASRAEAHADAALANERGFNPPHRPSEKGNNVTLKEIGKGNSAAYLAARLKKAGRDDLLEQIGPDKEFRSVRAAAIEAGIIKPVPTVRLVADMGVVAGKLCQHLTQQQRIQLIDLLAPDL